MSTHFKGPIHGAQNAAGGLLADAEMSLVARRDQLVYFNDFLEVDDFGTGDWTETDIGTVTVGSALQLTDVVGGQLSLVPDATDNEGQHIQYTAATGAGEFLVPEAGRTIVFEARVKAGDWDGQDYFIGIAETSATLLSAAGALDSDNCVGFLHQIADAGIISCVYAGTAAANETDAGDANAAVFTNDEFHTFGVRVVGTDRVWFYVDGIEVQSATMGTAFDDGMCISFGNVGSGALTDSLDIDFVYVAQTR